MARSWRGVSKGSPGLIMTQSLYSQTSLIRTPKGTEPSVRFTEVSYYIGRECMIFGISGTKRTVGNRDLSVL